MFDWVLQTHQAGVIGFTLLMIGIALGNVLTLRRIERYPQVHAFPRVAVLVPARNEEDNLEGCLQSLAAQDYPALMIWVLDDHSEDQTAAIALRIAERDTRVRLIGGTDLPDGWMGKHWACHQLAEAERKSDLPADLLIFVDADTQLHPLAVREMVAAMVEEKADALTVLPRQILGSPGEQLLVPYFLFAIFSFIPFFLTRFIPWPALAFGLGQVMIFRREAYDLLGGHAAVRTSAVDDLALARLAIRAGLRYAVVDGGERIFCRMYTSFRQAWDGFSKNMFPAFGYNGLVFLFVWLWSGILFLEPLAVIGLHFLGISLPFLRVDLAWVHLGLLVIVWAIPYNRLRFPIYLTLAFPVTFGLAAIVAFRSFLWTINGKAAWKGRQLIRQRIRWLRF